MATIYLGLGTNLGDKEANLRTAIYKLQERIGKQVSLSSFYETAPWGFKSDHSFLNAAIGLETNLSPIEVLHITQEIEKELGRTKTKPISRAFGLILSSRETMREGSPWFFNQVSRYCLRT